MSTDPTGGAPEDFLLDRYHRGILTTLGFHHPERRSERGAVTSRTQYAAMPGSAVPCLIACVIEAERTPTMAVNVLTRLAGDGKETIIALLDMETFPETVVRSLVGGPIGSVLSCGDPLADAAIIETCDQNESRLRITFASDLVGWLDPEGNIFGK